MTEEEKKAIKTLKNISTDDLLDCWDYGEEEYNAIQIILNLIKKQQKEIERQKEINKEHQELNGKLQTYIKELEEKVEKYKSTWD